MITSSVIFYLNTDNQIRVLYIIGLQIGISPRAGGGGGGGYIYFYGFLPVVLYSIIPITGTPDNSNPDNSNPR